jgi:hypothetical protein
MGTRGNQTAPIIAALLAVGALILFAPPASTSLALAIFAGRTIMASHALPGVLGPQTFSAPNAAWLPQGQLGALGITTIFEHGGDSALFCISVLFASAALLLTEYRCRARDAGAGAILLALALVYALSWNSLRVGGGIADLAFAGSLQAFLDRKTRASWAAALALSFVWCLSDSGGLLFAPLLLVCSALGQILDAQRLFEEFRRIVFVSGFAAMLIVTAKLELWPRALDRPPALMPGFMPMLLLVGWSGLSSMGTYDIVVALGAMFLGLLNQHALGVAGVIAAPIVACAFERTYVSNAQRTPFQRSARAWALVCVCAFSTAILTGCVARAHGIILVDGARNQDAVVQRLAADGKPHRLFCYYPEWCNLALMRNADTVRVFMDERRTSYPAAVRRDAIVIRFMWRGWRKRLDAWGIDAIETPNGDLAGVLMLLPEWKRVWTSNDTWLFEHRR